MIYLDNSAVVALLAPEDRSPQALDWFGQSRDPLISSDWLITETHSALGIKQSHHGLSSEARQAAGEQFERLLQGGVELRSLDATAFATQPSCSMIRASACARVTPCIWRWRGTAAALF
jgi:predicted nucleic acid-binding protein